MVYDYTDLGASCCLSNWCRLKIPAKKFYMSSNLEETDLYTLLSREYDYVIGLDEVGWGAIAGPLVVTGAVLPWEFTNPGFKDSKRYTTDRARAVGAQFAQEQVLDYCSYDVSPDDLAQYGPGSALSYSQKKVAMTLLELYPNAIVVVDGNRSIRGLSRARQLAVPKGDATVPAISAASIIAKWRRDSQFLQQEYHPEWEFHKNKGYPTPEHLTKLRAWGPIAHVHRMNVKAVAAAHEQHGWYEEKEENAKGTEAD